MDRIKLIDEIVNKIKADINSNDYSFQSLIDNNLSGLEKLKEEGVNYLRIHELCGFSESRKHFQTTIWRARQKKKRNNINNLNTECEPSKSKEISVSVDADNTQWKMIVPDINDRLISDIQTEGCTIDEVKEWVETFKITNSRLLRQHFNTWRNKKRANDRYRK